MTCPRCREMERVVEAVTDALYSALPFVEDQAGSPYHKKGFPEQMVKRVRAAIAKTENKPGTLDALDETRKAHAAKETSLLDILHALGLSTEQSNALLISKDWPAELARMVAGVMIAARRWRMAEPGARCEEANDLTLAVDALQSGPPARTKCWACPQCGYVEGRPFSNCGHVADDGTCKHPKNLTPECHEGACPMLPAESKTTEPCRPTALGHDCLEHRQAMSKCAKPSPSGEEEDNSCDSCQGTGIGYPPPDGKCTDCRGRGTKPRPRVEE